MIEIEVRDEVPDAGVPVDVLRAALAELGVERASVGVIVLAPDAMAEVNELHRGVAGPTDVLAFPLDGEDGLDDWPEDGPAPELGDIVLCPEAASDAADVLLVHGLLHLLGEDHEVDDGRMLARQAEIVAALRPAGAAASEGAE